MNEAIAGLVRCFNYMDIVYAPKEIATIDDFFVILKDMVHPTEFQTVPRFSSRSSPLDYVRNVRSLWVTGRKHELNVYGGHEAERKGLFKRICDEIPSSIHITYNERDAVLRKYYDADDRDRVNNILIVDEIPSPTHNDYTFNHLSVFCLSPFDSVLIYGSQERVVELAGEISGGYLDLSNKSR